MASKLLAAILTMLGGLLYVGVGVIIAASASNMASIVENVPAFANSGISTSEITSIAYGVGALDIISGTLIILGGFLINSDSSGRRKAGGVLAIVMMLVGALTSVGGFVIGFILTLIGAILGLRYKPEPAVAPGYLPQAQSWSPPPSQQQQQPPTDFTALPGRVNYCPNCGARLREGAAFCPSCGAKAPS